MLIKHSSHWDFSNPARTEYSVTKVYSVPDGIHSRLNEIEAALFAKPKMPFSAGEDWVVSIFGHTSIRKIVSYNLEQGVVSLKFTAGRFLVTGHYNIKDVKFIREVIYDNYNG